MINANSNNVNAWGPQLAADNRCPELEKEERDRDFSDGMPSGEVGLFPPSPDQVNLLVQFVGTKVAFVLQIAAAYQPEWGPQRW